MTTIDLATVFWSRISALMPHWWKNSHPSQLKSKKEREGSVVRPRRLLQVAVHLPTNGWMRPSQWPEATGRAVDGLRQGLWRSSIIPITEQRCRGCALQTYPEISNEKYCLMSHSLPNVTDHLFNSISAVMFESSLQWRFKTVKITKYMCGSAYVNKKESNAFWWLWLPPKWIRFQESATLAAIHNKSPW